MAKQWEIRFRVKGISGQQTTVITAKDSIDAKKLLQAQYGSSKVTFNGTKPVK